MPVSTPTRLGVERATMMAIGKQRPPVHLAFARSAARKHVVLHEPGIGGGQARSATAIYRAWPDRPGCGGGVVAAVDPPLWGGSRWSTIRIPSSSLVAGVRAGKARAFGHQRQLGLSTLYEPQ